MARFLLLLAVLVLLTLPSSSVKENCLYISPSTRLQSSVLYGRTIELHFINKGDAHLDIYLVDHSRVETLVGSLDSWLQLGYTTYEGVAWRVKFHNSSLVLMEYTVPVMLLSYQHMDVNSNMQPVLRVPVGEGCGSLASRSVTDPLVLFSDDKTPFRPEKRQYSPFRAMPEEATGSSACTESEQWVNKYVNSPGYHVVCITPSVSAAESFDTCSDKVCEAGGGGSEGGGGVSLHLQLWRNGHEKLNPSIIFISSFKELRFRLEELLAMERTDLWLEGATDVIRQDGENADGNSRRAFLPQRWRLFGVNRKPVEDLAEALRPELRSESIPGCGAMTPRLLLIFEGGQFIYPGVDLNFERVVEIKVADGVPQDGGEIKPQAQTKLSTYKLKTLSMRPLLFQVDHLLDDAECDYLISHSRAHLTQSRVKMDNDNSGAGQGQELIGREVDGISGDKDTSHTSSLKTRSSRGLFMPSSEHAVLQRIDRRISSLTGLDLINIEDVQMLKYDAGDYYLPHTDYLSPQLYQSPSMVKLTQAGHKNRLATVFWYMNSNVDGGCTSFPQAPLHNAYVSQAMPITAGVRSSNGINITSSNASIFPSKQLLEMVECDYGLKIQPEKGRAIIFYSLLPNGNGDLYSEHAACAVTSGTKWAANKWIWNQARNRGL